MNEKEYWEAVGRYAHGLSQASLPIASAKETGDTAKRLTEALARIKALENVVEAWIEEFNQAIRERDGFQKDLEFVRETNAQLGNLNSQLKMTECGLRADLDGRVQRTKVLEAELALTKVNLQEAKRRLENAEDRHERVVLQLTTERDNARKELEQSCDLGVIYAKDQEIEQLEIDLKQAVEAKDAHKRACLGIENSYQAALKARDEACKRAMEAQSSRNLSAQLAESRRIELEKVYKQLNEMTEAAKRNPWSGADRDYKKQLDEANKILINRTTERDYYMQLHRDLQVKINGMASDNYGRPA